MPPTEDRRRLAARLTLIQVCCTVVFAVLTFSFWFLQVVEGERYTVLAENNNQRTLTLRAKRGVTLKEMADELEVSSAYLSALEHGKRGQPSIMLVRQICAYFQIFWDEAEALERLAEMSHPRIVVDTAGLTPKATLVANLLADRIRSLDEAAIDRLLDVLNR